MIKSISKTLYSLRYSFAVFVGTVVLWHIIVVWTNCPDYLFPQPLKVIQTFIPRAGELGSSFLITLFEALGGFVLSTIIGITIGLIFAVSPFVRQCLSPHVVVLQTIPIVAISPLLCIWFGNGSMTVLLIATIICVPTIIINTTQGLISVDQNLLDLFRMGNASPLTVLLKLRLPNAVPSIFTGLRIAAGVSVVGATVGENFAGSSMVGRGGMGYSLYYAQTQLDTPYIFCLVAASAALGFGLFGAVVLAEWLLLRNWHSSYGESSN